jgi:hypothetical protein
MTLRDISLPLRNYVAQGILFGLDHPKLSKRTCLDAVGPQEHSSVKKWHRHSL